MKTIRRRPTARCQKERNPMRQLTFPIDRELTVPFRILACHPEPTIIRAAFIDFAPKPLLWCFHRLRRPPTNEPCKKRTLTPEDGVENCD